MSLNCRLDCTSTRRVVKTLMRCVVKLICLEQDHKIWLWSFFFFFFSVCVNFAKVETNKKLTKSGFIGNRFTLTDKTSTTCLTTWIHRTDSRAFNQTRRSLLLHVTSCMTNRSKPSLIFLGFFFSTDSKVETGIRKCGSSRKRWD